MGFVRIHWLGPVGLAIVALFTGATYASGQERHKIEIVPVIPHGNTISAVAFSRDGSRVVSASHDGTFKLWDVGTGLLVRTLHADSRELGRVAISADGTRVLGAVKYALQLWDAATGSVLRKIEGHADYIWAVTFSPDGTRALSVSTDAMNLWDVATGALLDTFEGHFSSGHSVAFSPDGGRILAASDGRTMKLWHATTGRLLRSFTASERIVSVAFSPDGRRVLSGTYNAPMVVWDATSGALLLTLKGHSAEVSRHDGGVSRVAFSSDGSRIISSSNDKTIRLWDAVTGAPLHAFTIADQGERVESIAFSRDGTRAVSSTGAISSTARVTWALKLWDTTTGTLVRVFDGHASPVSSVAFSRDGTRVLAGTGKFFGENTNALRLWDAASGTLLRTFRGHSNMVLDAVFSPDGTRVLSGSWDRTMKLWDTARATTLRTFTGHTDAVSSVAFSPDGARVLSGSWDRTVRLWDAATGTLLHTFAGHTDNVFSVAFSPDGRRVLSGSWDRTVRLWDTASGTLLQTFVGHTDGIPSVAFSPDGRRVLSGSWDRTARLWDTATGAPIRTFDGHSDGATLVLFTSDGRILLSGGTVRLWDAAGETLLHTLELDKSMPAAVSADGRRIATWATDGVVSMRDAMSGAQLAMLIGGRGEEWLAMLPTGFFAASRAGTELLGIVRGLEVTTIDQVHQSLFNPDLVREGLAGDPTGEMREAAKVIDLAKVLDSGPAPAVSIASPADGSQSATDLVTVTAGIEDRGKAVGRIEWRVNGITAAVAAKPLGTGPVYAVSRQLALDPGDNAIEVVAYNGSNLLASPPARTTVRFTGAADKAKPKLHILAIGINAYVDKGGMAPGSKAGGRFEPLDLAVKDAKALAASMEKAAVDLYDGPPVITLALDKEATRANLEKIVDKVAAQIHPRDTFILFAAGHGYSVQGRFYMIPQDYQGGINPSALATRAIGQDQLQDWLANRIKAKRALILLDTCESGALIAGYARSRTDGPASEAAVGRLHEATGRPVLTAAAVGQDAHEGEIGASGETHGYFTWAVLDALRNSDTNANGLIELSELVAHVQTVVPKIAAKSGGRGQAVVSERVSDKQVARFGSRGEDFAVARRLP